MISTVNLSVQFGEKPLFENVSIKFSSGNRYGLIGANGCGKSTFMKILSGEQEASSGEVVIDTNTRLGKLRTVWIMRIRFRRLTLQVNKSQH